MCIALLPLPLLFASLHVLSVYVVLFSCPALERCTEWEQGDEDRAPAQCARRAWLSAGVCGVAQTRCCSAIVEQHNMSTCVAKETQTEKGVGDCPLPSPPPLNAASEAALDIAGPKRVSNGPRRGDTPVLISASTPDAGLERAMAFAAASQPNGAARQASAPTSMPHFGQGAGLARLHEFAEAMGDGPQRDTSEHWRVFTEEFFAREASMHLVLWNPTSRERKAFGGCRSLHDQSLGFF